MGVAKGDQFEWTDAAVENLKLLWANGHSGSEIAGRLGAPGARPSRAAVIGKLHRLKQAGKGAGRGNSPRREQAHLNQRPATPKVARAVAVDLAMGRNPGNVAPMIAKAPLVVVKTAGPTAKSLNLRILDEGFGGCRWPTIEDADGIQHFCCVPSDGQPYCEAHAKRAFQAIPATGRKSASELARSLRRYL